MRIAFLNITQNIVDRGGETFVREVSERLKEKHEVVVLSGKKIPPKRWPFLWRFFVDPNGLAILKFTLENLPSLWREKFDVVIPVNGGWQPAFVRIITWLYGGKMVMSGQSGIGWDDIVNLWSFPDAFVAISSFAQKRSKSLAPFIKVYYIPNGVGLTKFKPKGERPNLELPKPLILYVGALEKGKRVLETIKAVSRLSGISLLVVGDGELKDKIERLGRELLGDRFAIKKFPHKDMPKVYRTADLFTIVSKPYHSFEIVLVEAMATNLPVVANDDPIRREIVDDAGIFVDPENTQEYANALKKALETKWGDRPRKQAEKFSWDKIAQEYEELLEEIIQ